MVEGPGCLLKGEKLRVRSRGQVVNGVSGNAVANRVKVGCTTLSRGGARIFERGGGGSRLGLQAKKGARRGSYFGPNVKSLHRGTKGGGPGADPGGGPRGPCPPPPSPQNIAPPNSQARIQGGPRGPWPPLTKSWIRLWVQTPWTPPPLGSALAAHQCPQTGMALSLILVRLRGSTRGHQH